MIDVNEYKNHFNRSVGWCKRQKKVVTSQYAADNEIVERIDEYCRNCLIIIRRIDLMIKKYPNLKFPYEIENDLEYLCTIIRYTALEKLENYLKIKGVEIIL